MKEHDLLKKLAQDDKLAADGKQYFDKLRGVARFAGKHPHLTSAAAVGLANGTVDAVEVPMGYKWMAFKRGLKRGAIAGGIASLIAHELPKHASPNIFRDAAGNAYDKAKDYVTKNKAGLIGGTIGAIGVGTLAYKSYKKKPGGQSAEQRMTEAAQKQIARDEMDMQEKGIEPNLGHKLKKTWAQTSHDIADSLSNHPGAAALATLPVGFASGSFIANQIAKNIGKK